MWTRDVWRMIFSEQKTDIVDHTLDLRNEKNRKV
jgi:hypothetical protein